MEPSSAAGRAASIVPSNTKVVVADPMTSARSDSDVVVASCKTDNFEIKAYDNFSGFAVQVLANFSDKVTIEIVDTRGRLIASKSVNIIEGMNNFQLDENISTGIYFIRLNGEKMNESLKVFKR